MRTQCHSIILVLPLIVYPGIDQVLGEDAAGQEKIMVLFKGFQDFQIGDIIECYTLKKIARAL